MARSFTLGDRITNSGLSQVTTNSWTIAGWVNPGATNGFFYGAVGTYAATIGIYVRTNLNKLAFFSSSGVSLDPGPSTLTVGTWYHVALAVNGGVSAQGYLNGATEGASFGNSGTSTPTGFNTGDDGTSDRLSTGTVAADVAAWSTNLSALEIAALANGIRPWRIRPASLKIWWPLDGLQSPEPDLSGGAHNGTLTGTASAFGPPISPITPRWSAGPSKIFQGPGWPGPVRVQLSGGVGFV